MGVQIAAQVLEAYELGQPPGSGGLDLAPVLAQFRRNEGQGNLIEDAFLGGAGDAPRPSEYAVLVDLETPRDAKLAHGDVVRLRPCEVVQRRAIALLRHNPQVDLQSGAQHDGGAGVAVGNDLGHLVVGDEPLHHVGALAGGDENVQVADGLLAPPIAARDHGLLHAFAAFQVLEQWLGEVFRSVEPEPLLDLPFVLELADELELGLGAEAGKPVQLAGGRGLLQVGDGVDLELVEEDLGALGTDAGYGGQLDEAGRRAALHLLEQRQPFRLHELRDLGGEVLADAWQLGEVLALCEHVGNAVRQVADRARGVTIGAHAERVGTFDLEKIGKVVEGAGDLRVVDGHDAGGSRIAGREVSRNLR